MRRGQAHRIGLRGHVFRCVAGPLALLVLLDLLASATLAVHYAGQRYDADLLASGRALAKLVEQRDDHVQLPAAARFLLAHEGHRSLYFQVVDRQGRTVAGNAHLTGGAKAASADIALYDLPMPDGPARVARLATSHGGAAAVAVGTLFSAGISLVKVLADPSVQLPSITFWLLGGLNAVTPGDLAFAVPPLIIGLTPLLLARWQINLLSLSDEEATALGVNVARLRLVLVASATLMTAAAVAIAGIIGWVGLVIPHAARLLVGPEFSRLLPASLLLGGAFLVLADTLARSATSLELPLGILTALVGAPAFLYLLASSGRSS